MRKSAFRSSALGVNKDLSFLLRALHKITAKKEPVGVASDQEKMNCLLFPRSGSTLFAVPLVVLICDNIKQRLEFYFE